MKTPSGVSSLDPEYYLKATLLPSLRDAYPLLNGAGSFDANEQRLLRSLEQR